VIFGAADASEISDGSGAEAGTGAGAGAGGAGGASGQRRRGVRLGTGSWQSTSDALWQEIVDASASLPGRRSLTETSGSGVDTSDPC